MLEGGISAKPNREAAQRYLAESKKGWTIISLFAQADKESTGEEVIPDPDADVEEKDRKSTRLNSSHRSLSRMPSSA